MLRFDRVTRRFADRTVLDGIDFTVPGGCLTGFVGANGAGKTTTMRIALGVLAPDSGAVLWGDRPATAGDRARFGYMPEERGLYPRQAIAEQLEFFGEIHRLSRREAADRTRRYLEMFGLWERRAEPLESLSLGNQQRVQIIAALIHDPVCLVLDEPFSGLDPVAVDAMGGLLRERAAAGVPVLFSSHQLDLVERLCDELVVIADGRIRAAGPAEQLRERGGVRYRVQAASGLPWIDDVAGIEIVGRTGDSVDFREIDPGAKDLVLAKAVGDGAVESFGRIRPTLTELFHQEIR